MAVNIQAGLGGTAGMLQNNVQRSNQLADQNRVEANEVTDNYLKSLKQKPINDAIKNNTDGNGKLNTSAFLQDVSQNAPESYMGLSQSIAQQDNDDLKAQAQANSFNATADKNRNAMTKDTYDALKSKLTLDQNKLDNLVGSLSGAKSNDEKNSIIANFEKENGEGLVPQFIKNADVNSPDWQNNLSMTSQKFAGVLKAQNDHADSIYNRETARKNADTAEANATTASQRLSEDKRQNDINNMFKSVDQNNATVKNTLDAFKSTGDVQKAVNDNNNAIKEEGQNYNDIMTKLQNSYDSVKAAYDLLPNIQNIPDILTDGAAIAKNSDVAKFNAALNQIISLQTLDSLNTMKGFGSLSDADMKILKESKSAYFTSKDGRIPPLDTIKEGFDQFFSKYDKKVQQAQKVHQQNLNQLNSVGSTLSDQLSKNQAISNNQFNNLSASQAMQGNPPVPPSNQSIPTASNTSPLQGGNAAPTSLPPTSSSIPAGQMMQNGMMS